MNCLYAIKKIIRFECECPNCLSKIRSDDITSDIYRLDIDEVVDISYGEELYIECRECGHNFKIDEVDWEG